MPHPKPHELNAETARHLAVLHGAGEEAIEATIALLPLGERMELAANELIATHGGASTGIRLTNEGREAIAECADWLADEPGGADAVLKRTPDELEEELHRIAGAALGKSRGELAEDLERIATRLKAGEHRGVTAS